MTDFSYIKLIIWDLDDTLWQGTLSEGDVLLSDKIVTLIKRLTDCGIVNSICSKNDKAIVEQKLQELHLLDYFVFNSIDWTPKGTRIQSILDNIGLRAENTLFIDDNMVNLNEARYYEPNIHIAEPAILQDLIHYYNSVEAKDLEHSRLKSYRVLEQKQISKSQYSDNTAFLFSTNTRVEIKKDCLQHLDRIEELVNRTNQLNYTKRRCSRDELSQLLSDTTVDAGYVVVEDNFGKYGIVGFYAIKNNECIHFLFSCRTIGQGVEQYVYSILNFPNISVVGDVIVDLKRIPAPQWINQKNHSCRENRKRKLSGKVLFKGPCDLSSMVLNFDSSSILTEFTYIGEHQNSIEHHNHSVNYLRFPFLSQIERDELQTECMFNDVQMFDTELFNPEVGLVFLSTLIEANLAIYRRKRDGYLLAFGEYCNDLTDKNNFDKFLKNELYCYSNNYTEEWLQTFAKNWEYCGRITPQEYIQNLKMLLQRFPQTTKLCLMLGSELPYMANSQKSYENRHVFHKEMNEALRLFAHNNDRILLLDFNEFIHNQNDFTNNINHFQRRVYYEISQKANEYIEQVLGEKLTKKNSLKRMKEIYVPQIKGWIFEHTPMVIKDLRNSIRNR